MVLTHPLEVISPLAKAELDAIISLPINIRSEVKIPLCLQSLHGRMVFGHGNFVELPQEDISMEEVCLCVDEDPKLIKQKRQKLVDGMKKTLDKLLDGNLDCLHHDGFPVYGIDFLDEIQIENRQLALKGAALAGYMDSTKWREKTIQRYHVNLRGSELKIGSGQELLVDTERMKELGHTTAEFADNEHTYDDIQRLYDQRVFVLQNGKPEITNQFVRSTKGPGVCDDAAITSIGRIYGMDAMLMAFLMDATDTYGKFVTHNVTGGVDEEHADYICQEYKKRTGKELIEPEEIMRIIYLGAKNNSPSLHFSSSHRRFCQHEHSLHSGEHSMYPTLINHLMFLFNESEFYCNLGFDQFSSRNFYQGIKTRWESFKEAGNELPCYNLVTNDYRLEQ